ncbi:MotA/TolQ/ExbB proton channel family protein [Rhodobacter sp. M37P]|uniref:MotA/TolQ/ExbB proton channel family protein n=2 Tax=Rhodobacter calidifons TaxID=2715277 RepID=A0ABX0G884_9RHOB|nr:MotA/TolQ/ExbB proton channel family protein [Rhodobacter calidifons]
MIDLLPGQVRELLMLGGPVIWLLTGLSVVALAVILFKLWQFWRAGLGRHAALEAALADWDAGQADKAQSATGRARSGLVPVLSAALASDGSAAAAERVDAMAEDAMARLEGGFRLLDAISQTAPLLGLFGTVLGMIEAFRAMQGAGAAVDPSVLAGGIWVALLTTAVGLAVAIPTGLMLTWFEARVAAERLWLAGALARVRAPLRPASPAAAGGTAPLQPLRAHAG